MSIWFDGVSSDDVNVIVEHNPIRMVPDRKLLAVNPVPGRNGDIIVSDDSFNNYVQPYDIYVSAEKARLNAVAWKVAEWLTKKGYKRLVDGYDIDCYRLAYFQGPLEIENIVQRFGRGTIEFNCKPQRFLNSGDIAVQYTTNASLRNPTSFDALPLIRVYGNGAFQVNGNTITISGSTADYIDIDSDIQNCYVGSINANSLVTLTEFPKLIPGANEITIGTVEKLEITPRWWTL